ncbi:MAG: permease-like cell division protein FtsX [Dysosmobacter sp.]
MAYVDDSYTEEQAKALQSQLEKVPNVASATYISKEEAMEDFKAQYPDEEMFQGSGPGHPPGPLCHPDGGSEAAEPDGGKGEGSRGHRGRQRL